MQSPDLALLDAAAEKRCREVGTATMLVGVLPLLGALVALVIAPLVTHRSVDLLVGLLGLLVSCAFFGLGYAMRRRLRWSFKVAMVVFTGIAVGGLAMLLVAGDGQKVSFLFVVALPLVFAATAYLAERAVKAHERLRDEAAATSARA